MTDKNLLYFMVRLNVCMHDADAHWRNSQLALMQAVHRILGAIQDGVSDNNRPPDVYAHLLMAKSSLLAASEVTREAVSWFTHDCPKPTEERDLLRDWSILNIQCRISPIRLEGLVPDMQPREGAAETFSLLSSSLKIASDSAAYVAGPNLHRTIMAAIESADNKTLMQIYRTILSHREVCERVFRFHAALNQRCMEILVE